MYLYSIPSHLPCCLFPCIPHCVRLCKSSVAHHCIPDTLPSDWRHTHLKHSLFEWMHDIVQSKILSVSLPSFEDYSSVCAFCHYVKGFFFFFVCNSVFCSKKSTKVDDLFDYCPLRSSAVGLSLSLNHLKSCFSLS